MTNPSAQPQQHRNLAQQYPYGQDQFPVSNVRQTPRRRARGEGAGCSCFLSVIAAFLLAVLLVFVYLMAPIRTDFLLLGIDRAPEGTSISRTDTIILMSVNPLMPTVRMLSIPRDLWVFIPGVGENRINTAHFFAEANETGSGPAAAARTVEENFGVSVPYFLRLRFDAVTQIVEAMGGVTVDLAEDTGLLPAGRHHLNGEQALAFVRDRQGADDFFRMEHAQIMLRSIAVQMVSPAMWPRIPTVATAAMNSVDTNIPFWLMPRIGAAIIRGALNGGLDARTIRREMTTPFTTDEGASVLLPNWDLIRPAVQEMFP